MKVLGRKFYDRASMVVACELIGKTLVRITDKGSRLEGEIVEVEAYGGIQDPASHAFRGQTERNAAMFREPGHAYVYFTYGAHYCLNFVTSSLRFKASAVLIRAVKPTRGIKEMSENRGISVLTQLASGPGKLCQALSINSKSNGIDLTAKRSKIRVLDNRESPKVKTSARIGITRATEKMWRFYNDTSPFVSRSNFKGET
jgi:DNA-3-methyladenine glycosylase